MVFHSREVHDDLLPLYYFVKRKIGERDGIALNSALAWLQVCRGRRDGRMAGPRKIGGG